jgi:UDP-2,3-diacylglucosamine pyrophosphatase LpxH
VTFSNYDPARISRALDRALARALAQEDEEGPRVFDLNADQFVIFSDQHKGARNGADDFQVAEEAYHTALSYYDKMGYTLVTLGDVEELWEERPQPVIKSYPDIFEIESGYHQKERYLRIWGNHDDNWRYPDQVEKHLWPVYGDPALKVRETILLRVKEQEADLGDILLLHGHQGTLDSDRFAKYSRWFVRYLWRPFQRLTRIPSNTPAKDWRLRHEHNIAMYNWTESQRGLLLIAGHTHRPVFESRPNREQIELEIESMSELIKRNPDDRRLRDRLGDLQNELDWLHKARQPVPLSEAAAADGLTRAEAQRKPSYYNTGCCCYPDGTITGIELVAGEIRLVRWPRENGQYLRQVLERGDLRNILRAC